MDKKAVKRYYSLDVLRIIAMLMIITLHYCTFGLQIAHSKSMLLWLIYAFCYVAVDIYVLISGFFLCESKFKWKKVLSLWVEVLFYSVSVFIVFFVSGKYDATSMKGTLMVFMPILAKQYWFITIYLIMYILSPFINKFINVLTKREFQIFLIITSVLFLILNNLIPGTNLVDDTRGFGILWFVYLYCVAAYIRKYDLFKMCNSYYLLLYGLFSFITFFTRIFIIKYLRGVQLVASNPKMFYAYNSLTVFLASVALFMYFKNVNMKEIFPKLVSKISVSTFGVYLLHEHYLVRKVLYRHLRISQFKSSTLLVRGSAMITSILLVFVVGIIIDLIRSKIFKKIDL